MNQCRLATLCLALLTSAATAQPVESRYTSTKGGVILKQPRNDEPGDFITKRCPGLGGYEVIYQGDDARSWLDLKFGKTSVSLRQPTFRLAPDAPYGFPNKANDVVEWRGLVDKGVFNPYALIYRLEASDTTSGRTRSRLIVILLHRGESRVIGFAEGKNEDAEAKKLADRFRPK